MGARMTIPAVGPITALSGSGLVEEVYSEATQHTSYAQIKRSTSTWKLMPLLGTQTA